jgi:hypothetical protein
MALRQDQPIHITGVTDDIPRLFPPCIGILAFFLRAFMELDDICLKY